MFEAVGLEIAVDRPGMTPHSLPPETSGSNNCFTIHCGPRQTGRPISPFRYL